MSSISPALQERFAELLARLVSITESEYSGIIIHDGRIIQQAGQRPWVSLPQRDYIHAGQKKYAAVVEWRDPLKREGSRAVLAAWERRGSDAR